MFYIILLLLATIPLLVSCIVIVRQQTVAIVETLGSFATTLEPGFNLIWPRPISRVVHIADLRIREIETEVDIKTSDNQFVRMPAALMLKVSPDHVAESYYKLDNPDEQISRWVLNTVRSIAASMTLDELFTDREKIVQDVTKELESKTREFGFIIESVLVEQPTVSDVVQKSFNRVLASQRDMEAAKQDAEANKIRIVAAANAEAEGQIARAKGLSESRAILVRSLEENINSITKTGADLESSMELLLSVNRLDAIRDVGHHGNLILMDLRDPNVGLHAQVLKNQKNAADTQ